MLGYRTDFGASLVLGQAPAHELSSIAPWILGAYLILLLVLGYLGQRRGVSNEEDYYLAGRQQGWIVSSLTIMATFFSSFALLGAPGLVYKEGVAFALFALNVPLAGAAVYVLGKRLAKAGREHGYVTPGDMIVAHYDSRIALRLLTALVGLLYAVPYVVMQINAGGILTEVLFPNAANAFEWGAVGLAIITMVYVMVGGMRSVAWTDVVQGTLLIGGMLIAGWATVETLGGVRSFFARLEELPPAALTVPGTSGSWPPWKLFTVCVFGSLGSMIQPAQWMRYYAAGSAKTLRRSAIIFATVLPVCFLFGVMLVGLGGQALYPLVEGVDGGVLPHPSVGATARDFDRILIVILEAHLPELLGSIGSAVSALILVAIMAASMSTADSNLHALSAVITRDVYDHLVRPHATDRERTWFGRAVIAVVTLIALGIIFWGRTSEHFSPIALIAQMGLLAIAFSVQLLPITLDMLFLKRGTRAGAVAGLLVGLSLVFLGTPFASMITGSDSGLVTTMGHLRRTVDLGALGCIANMIVFASVSLFTAKPPSTTSPSDRSVVL